MPEDPNDLENYDIGEVEAAFNWDITRKLFFEK